QGHRRLDKQQRQPRANRYQYVAENCTCKDRAGHVAPSLQLAQTKAARIARITLSYCLWARVASAATSDPSFGLPETPGHRFPKHLSPSSKIPSAHPGGFSRKLDTLWIESPSSFSKPPCSIPGWVPDRSHSPLG